MKARWRTAYDRLVDQAQAFGPDASVSPGVTYHVRAVASNSSGTNTGTDMTFTTTGPSFVHSAPAGGISSNGATLAGTVDPNGHTTTWYFQYGNGTSYGHQTPSHSRET